MRSGVRLVMVASALTVAAACASPPVAAPDGAPDAVTDSEADTAPDTAPETAAPTTTGSEGDTARYTPAELGTEFGDAVWRVEVSDCGVESGGTAFAIADDLLVTNEHVVTFDMAPVLFGRDGRELQGRVIGLSTDPDVAVIRVDEQLGQWLEWTPAAELTEGETVVSIGYPMPLGTFSVAPGTLLSFEVEGGERISILSDESSDYGSSGGPLLDTRGLVAGVVTEFAPEGGQQITGLSYTYEYLRDTIDGIVAAPEELETDCSGASYGSDPTLDVLYDLCGDGRYWACDVLYAISDAGSAYETFAASCGDRIDTAEWCTDEFSATIPDDYGSDAYLDGLWDLCASSSPDGAAACDELYLIAPAGSRYEDFGYSCGDRFADATDLCVNLEY